MENPRGVTIYWEEKQKNGVLSIPSLQATWVARNVAPRFRAGHDLRIQQENSVWFHWFPLRGHAHLHDQPCFQIPAKALTRSMLSGWINQSARLLWAVCYIYASFFVGTDKPNKPCISYNRAPTLLGEKLQKIQFENGLYPVPHLFWTPIPGGG